MGTTLYLRRIGDGDKTELFYELKEAILKSLWAKLERVSSEHVKRYLNSEDVHTFMSDRFEETDPDGVTFAFWDVDDCAQDVAVHGFDVIFALDAKRLDKLARARGFTVDFEKHDLARVLAEGPHQPFWVGNQHVRVNRWRRDRPADAMPETSLDAKAQVGPQTIAEMTWIAMTGWCRCDLCVEVRKRKKIAEPALTDAIPRAWALLSEPRGAELVKQSDSLAVLGDWLEERGASVPRELLPGLVANYGR